MIFEISSLKNFAIFTGKHLRWVLFLIKLQVFRHKSCTSNSLLTRDKTISFLLEYFRICFGKTLVAFDFDEKLTQSVTQITI